MQATEDYYKNKIAKLEAKLQNIQNVYDAFAGTGARIIPIEALREVLLDGEQ